MLAVLRYLLVDWLCSWRESPGAALSKSAVAGLLAGVAAMILLSLTMAERSAESSLRAFGDTTVVVSEPALSASAGSVHAAIPEALAAVGGGRRLHVGMAILPVEYDGKVASCFLYDPAQLRDWGDLAQVFQSHPRVLLDESMPPGARYTVLLGNLPAQVVVGARPVWFKRIQDGPCLLVPMQPSDHLQRRVLSDITVIETARGPESAMALAQWLRQYQAAEKCFGVTVRDPAEILKELGNISAAHTQWRSAILLVIAPLVALVFGTLTILEFRELRHTAALMRSLGTPGWLLWLRYLCENTVLALLAACLVLVPCGLQAADLFNAMGSPVGLWTAADSAAFFRADAPVVLLALGIGATLSTLPVAVGLMKPVGRVLP